MKISARLYSDRGKQNIKVMTNDSSHSINIPSKVNGNGSSVNGGELLFLALATCYCNDIYREAAKRNITIKRVDVEVEGEFGAEGEPARNINYRAKVEADVSDEEILNLMRYVDKVAEIQNTLRNQNEVTLSNIEIII